MSESFRENKKSKSNRLKVGQKVRAKNSLVNWHATNLTWSYGIPANDPGYDKDDNEIGPEDLPQVYAWAGALISGKMPKGTVTHYGAKDWDNKLLCHVDRKCVWVEFKFKTELGTITNGVYVSEEDLEPIKKKKK